MVLENRLLRKQCVAGCGTGQGADPSGQREVIAEVMYDSPLTADAAVPGNEEHTGEWVQLVNVGKEAADLSGMSLRLGGQSVALDGSIPAGGRMFVAYCADGQCVLENIPAGAQVRMQTAFELPDGSGTLALVRGDAVLDAVSYGKFFGLDAGNAYLDGSSLKSVQKKGYPTSLGGRVVIGPPAFGGGLGMEVDVIDPEIEPVVLGKPAIGRFALERGWKAYELKNHLGNVLAVVSDLKIGKGVLGAAPLVGHYEADVLEMADYYPFGMVLPKRAWSAGGRYRFGFNGKEQDDEWNGAGNMLNYGFRIHDPRLGRFLSVDPLAPEYPWYTPYQYAGNRPINSVDLDGLEPQEKGTYEGKAAYAISPENKESAMRLSNTGVVPNSKYIWHAGTSDLGNANEGWMLEADYNEYIHQLVRSKSDIVCDFSQFTPWLMADNVYNPACVGDLGLNQERMGVEFFEAYNASSGRLRNPEHRSQGLEDKSLEVALWLESGVGIAKLGYHGVKAGGAWLFTKQVAKSSTQVAEGSFSVFNWRGYPAGGVKPTGPFRLLDGDEYIAARNLANKTNAALHQANPQLKGLQIHEIHPVKFGGSPTDMSNKIF